MSPQMNAEKDSVKIRMYCQGLGDCFLLAFNGEDNKPRYMLIDCGVLQKTKNDKIIMKEVAENIKEATGGHIHVLVISHEHWDHISGFEQAETVFKDIMIDQVWFGWTENPDDNNAQVLRAQKDKLLNALRMIVENKDKDSRLKFAEGLEGLLGFHGELSDTTGRQTSAGIMEMVRGWGEKKPSYFSPGNSPHQMPGVAEVRFFVLGPPESTQMLKRSKPRTGEVYLTDLDSDYLDIFAQKVFHMLDPDLKGVTESDTTAAQKINPFDQRYMIVPQTEEAKPIDEFVNNNYNNIKYQWRNIDNLWLEASEDLALHLDSNTNNTSLVLAIELIGTGKVLLFPGDAQVGNWLSWEGLTWQVDNKTVTSQELLSRTVLYKVGHHGSHNATLREKGLELMTHSELTAMIPVNEDMAKQQTPIWKMPFEPLYQRLKELCKGRIIRADTDVPTHKPADISQELWDNFKAQAKKTNLYCEYTVK